MAKILVTGGAGYIGSHILNLLSKTNHEVVVYDNLSTGRKESVTYGDLIIEDLENIEKLEEIIKKHKFDSCMHFAGSIIVPESVSDPLKYYNNNTSNTLNLLNLCVKYGVNNFIFSSTAAVYGMGSKGEDCSEESATFPINPYGKTKLMTEWMLDDIDVAHEEFNFVVLRYFNVAGANVEGKVGQCSPLSTHLIKLACETALGKRDKLKMFGDDYDTPDGTCIRDYIHVDDLAQAHIDAHEYLLNGGESTLCNCGYGHGYSVKEVLEVVKKVSGVDFPVETVGRRAGDAPDLKAKADKIKKVLGWKPKYNDLELIVKTAYDWEKGLGK